MNISRRQIWELEKKEQEQEEKTKKVHKTIVSNLFGHDQFIQKTHQPKKIKTNNNKIGK